MWEFNECASLVQPIATFSVLDEEVCFMFETHIPLTPLRDEPFSSISIQNWTAVSVSVPLVSSVSFIQQVGFSSEQRHLPAKEMI